MANTKKTRSDSSSRKRFQSSRNQFRIHVPDETSDMMEVKRVKFRDHEAGFNHSTSSRVDACSMPCEAREAPPIRVVSSGDPKTSEFAYFMKLKQGASHKSCVNSGNRENTELRTFGLSNYARGASESSKQKNVKSPLHDKKSSTLEVVSSLFHEDGTMKNSGVDSQAHGDNERVRTSLMRTPRTKTIDLESFLSNTANFSLNPGEVFENQVENGDIFSIKRLKLKQQITKNLFPEADTLPKECDVVSLLMSRLLPDQTLETFSEVNISEIKDRHQLHHDGFEESWGDRQKLVQANEAHLFGDGMSDDFLETNSIKPLVKVFNTYTTRYADSLLLGVGNDPGSIHVEIDDECWSERFGDKNLLTWSNEQYDYPTKYESSCKIVKNDEIIQYPRNVFDSGQSYRFRGQMRSYEFPTTSHDCYVDISGRRICLSDEDDGTECIFNRQASDSWHPIPFKVGSSGLCSLKDSAELNAFETRGEPCPLLLSWGTNESDVQALTHNKDIDHELYPPSPSSWIEDDLGNKGYCTPLNKYSSILSSSYLLPSPSNTEQDHYTRAHYWLQQKDSLARSSLTPLTSLCCPDQQNSDDAGLFEDMCKDSSYSYVIPKDYTRNVVTERIFPAVGALIMSHGLESDLGLKCSSLSGFSVQQYDISSDGFTGLLRPEKPSSQFLLQNENSFTVPQSEEWTLKSLDSLAQTEVSFPLQLHRVKWLDPSVETYSDSPGVATYDDLL